MEEEVQSYTAAPIIANGDPIGAVLILAKESTVEMLNKKLSKQQLVSSLAKWSNNQKQTKLLEKL